MTADPVCAWFLNCQQRSIGLMTHPTLGEVEICENHCAWVLDNPSPTKMIPPMVADAARRMGADHD